jgi:hypothetical protein
MARAISPTDCKTHGSSIHGPRACSTRERGPQPSGPIPTPRQTVLSEDDLIRFVERTTRASDVPVLVDDVAVVEQIARVLS